MLELPLCKIHRQHNTLQGLDFLPFWTLPVCFLSAHLPVHFGHKDVHGFDVIHRKPALQNGQDPRNETRRPMCCYSNQCKSPANSLTSELRRGGRPVTLQCFTDEVSRVHSERKPDVIYPREFFLARNRDIVECVGRLQVNSVRPFFLFCVFCLFFHFGETISNHGKTSKQIDSPSY